ncbi:hypothetical protein HETIRDRAFT_109035 [Heterobasidion irregulare TC 32-1]|uniref:Uncharacterized protein n=1 Tax=Heterobasidion irregulare (strain TC 32-1) TaxID=747525 RepID=W4JZC7_HETIT|nr:uncharacterized protein HETIRDRAFT_109035 [Heterobasidion irregulare TC 32-1]ETW78440.1 hypothetical protein HETIRDRAFT_109035 [Heterobasidion irregulare TC 32-1]
MENFRCLTRDSNNKAVYGPWDRSNVVEMGGQQGPGRRRHPLVYCQDAHHSLAEEVHDYCERLRNYLVAEELQGRRGWVWSPATIVSPLGAPIVVKYKPGSLAAEQYGSQLVHVLCVVPDTQDAMRFLMGMGQLIG